MVGAVISFLILVLVAALILYLVIYVLVSVAGLPVPPKVIQIVWVIFMLIVIGMAWNRFGSHLTSLSEVAPSMDVIRLET